MKFTQTQMLTSTFLLKFILNQTQDFVTKDTKRRKFVELKSYLHPLLIIIEHSFYDQIMHTHTHTATHPTNLFNNLFYSLFKSRTHAQTLTSKLTSERPGNYNTSQKVPFQALTRRECVGGLGLFQFNSRVGSLHGQFNPTLFHFYSPFWAGGCTLPAGRRPARAAVPFRE